MKKTNKQKTNFPHTLVCQYGTSWNNLFVETIGRLGCRGKLARRWWATIEHFPLHPAYEIHYLVNY